MYVVQLALQQLNVKASVVYKIAKNTHLFQLSV
jgi:hypothetical protein